MNEAMVTLDVAIKLNEISRIVSEPFHVGTRVTNCVLHMTLPFTGRPHDCELCRTDLENQFEFALRVNKWLNERLDAVRDVVGVQHR